MVDPAACSDFITYRIRMGLTLRDLSERTGLSPATLHRLESRKCRITTRSKIRLQSGLDLPIETLEKLIGFESGQETTTRSKPRTQRAAG